MSIVQLARANVRNLRPYQSARRLGGRGSIWLNANESPEAPARQLSSGDFHRYPEPQPAAVINGYAAYAGVAPENVLVSRGGDEAIELLLKTFCEPDDAVLYCPPTYGMYAVSAATLGLPTVTVPLTADFQLDLPAIEAALPGVKVLFICNPNNPTGTRVRRADLLALLELTAGRAIVAVDEAYMDYSSTDSLVNELPRWPHLALVRTLSKAFALAGLRCGFTLANRELIGLLQKVSAPYPLPGPVADLAAQALQPAALEQMRGRVAASNRRRERFATALAALPSVAAVHGSGANFLLVRFSDGPATFAALGAAGIITRSQQEAYGLTDHLRITIGSDDELAAVLAVLKTL